jgi:uncharacterized membrane protein (UPF0182 family)
MSNTGSGGNSPFGNSPFGNNFGGGFGNNFGGGANPFANFGRRNPEGPRKVSPLAITLGVLFILALGLLSLSGFYADLLWFRSVDFVSVWQTTLFTKAYLFVGFGFLTALIVTANIYIAFRKRPIYVPLNVEADNLERYRAQLEPIRKLVIVGVFASLFYFAGSAGSRLWQEWLLFRNATPFGVTDPQFNKDVSFFEIGRASCRERVLEAV